MLRTVSVFFRKKVYIVFFATTLLLVEKSYADAWLQPEGSGLIITSFNLSSFNETDTTTGGSLTDRKVGSYQIQNYLEYGLSSRITIGAKIIFTNLFQDKNGGIFGKPNGNSARFDTNQIFSRIQLLHYKYFTISTNILIGFPQLGVKNSYLNKEFANNCFEFQSGVEMGFSFGQDENYLQNYNVKKPFITLSYYYKKRMKVFDQITYFLTVGIPVLERSIMFLKFQKINYIFHDLSATTAPEVLNPNGTQFSFVDISFSYLTKISEFTHIEFGYKQSLHIKWLNTNSKQYKEKGFFVAMWFYF